MIVNLKEGKEKVGEEQKTNRNKVGLGPKASLLWSPLSREVNQGTEKELELQSQQGIMFLFNFWYQTCSSPNSQGKCPQP